MSQAVARSSAATSHAARSPAAASPATRRRSQQGQSRHPSAQQVVTGRAASAPRQQPAKPLGQPANVPSQAPSQKPSVKPSHEQATNLKVAPKRRFRRLFVFWMFLGLLGLVAVPFGIVYLHATLIAGQRELDQKRIELNEQLELRQELQFERSLAVLPERILQIAQEELGMVPAERITYLQATAAPATPASEGAG